MREFWGDQGVRKKAFGQTGFENKQKRLKKKAIVDLLRSTARENVAAGGGVGKNIRMHFRAAFAREANPRFLVNKT